ncbi:hypothetical protein [Vibrio parahaemolyticus]|uniref:hypothetical protein n=1 Tax=Vibrio parahaemolyticus TaxID=670 RepID=UPI0001BC6E3B|nr:hypothetical protein [Vibrio parahaemolyticus]EFO47199.1 hypothetical protein VIPARAQ4037_0830 [Vibrio parahaemolyticus AQ4037]EGQ8178028.1 hypothetical protein [Vibrio parahaemolyticus]EGQ8282868.1 hypothetical protein [Vibrio parahaemolyticus]EGQ8332008.1 hypothetical protein [Vibrio parahaemolyticus]EGQ8534633.1 hypothetical protein [Vibrio parahaemolyticus]
MSLVSIKAPQRAKIDEQLVQEEKVRKMATVYSLHDRKKMLAFESAKKNMKLAASKLDW